MEKYWKLLTLAVLVLFVGSLLLPLAEPQQPEWLFTLHYVYNSEQEFQLKIGQIIKEAYAKIGIDLELNGYDSSTFFSRTISQPGPVIKTWEEGGFDVCYMNYGMQIPDMIWYIGCYNTEGINPNGWNFWAWNDGKANMLLRKAMGTYNFTERQQAAWDWQEEHQEDVGTIVLYHKYNYIYHRADLTNFSLRQYHYYDVNYWQCPRSEIKFNYRGSVNQLNPMFLDGGYPYLEMMYRCLYKFALKNGVWVTVPDLADGMPEYSEDGLTATIHLVDSDNDGVVDFNGKPVVWHDGVPFTSADVKYTYETILNPDTGSTYAGDLGAAVASVETPDATTVVLKLNKISPELPALLATYGALLLPKHVLEDVPPSELKTHSTNTVAPAPGLGPYKFVSWTEGQEMVLEAFDDFYLGRPNIDKIVMTFIQDASTIRAALEAGDIDTADVNIEPADHDALVDNPDITVERIASNTFTFFPPNHEHPILNNRYVRRALAWAIPYDDLINTVEYGRAYKSNGPIEKGLWFWNPNAMYYDYNLEKARENLRLAGYPEWPPPVQEIPLSTYLLPAVGGLVAGVIIGFVANWAIMRRRRI